MSNNIRRDNPFLNTDVLYRQYYGDKMITTLPYVCYQRPVLSIIENKLTDYRRIIDESQKWITDVLCDNKKVSSQYNLPTIILVSIGNFQNYIKQNIHQLNKLGYS
jgi:hypothetical protein